MSYLAAISQWLDPWGPIGWGAAGLITFVVLLLTITAVRMGLAWLQGKKQLSEFVAVQMQAASVNPLHDNFERSRVKVWDFFHPYFEQNRRKVFRNCELLGPCNILFNGHTNMPRSKINECEVVIIKPDTPMRGAVAFEDCTFLDCTFYRLTFFMTAEMARALSQQLQENGRFDGEHPLHVISDGQYGQI